MHLKKSVSYTHLDVYKRQVEYYRVNNLQNYDEVYRAMGFFIGKYEMCIRDRYIRRCIKKVWNISTSKENNCQ